MRFRALSDPFLIDSGTPRDLPTPIPTRPLLSPTMTTVRKAKRRPLDHLRHASYIDYALVEFFPIFVTITARFTTFTFRHF